MMFRTLLPIVLVLITDRAIAATKRSHPKAVPQTQVVFEDHMVPQFRVVEKDGKKRVVIDRSHLKSQVEIKTK